ncbi:FAD-binding protein [Paracoccus sp. Z330]|uniref:FAD-binding protein n=1 Tax=Paracoccus onchidii TaxID=3017813 RepID=A0ABT4Z9Z2_9RHOB|nr:FAD-binding protein [Paracoccus onchidii]MDB6176173.1 FAD-binding protein [Paracoccus onchidii]
MRPENEAELAARIRAAQQPVSIAGGGTRHLPGEGLGTRLDMTAIQGITLYEPEALTLVVRTGTPLAGVEKLLADEGQMLGFEPGRAAASTIGGVFAANSSGPRRIQLGAARDALIGVRFVDGSGNMISNGGRVMKNVTGYDLVKLMAGSRGRLGALTEVSLRTTPIPRASCTLVLGALDAVAALPALMAALASPLDLSGAAWAPHLGAILRIEGLPHSVDLRAQMLKSRLSPFGDAEILDHDPWPALRDQQKEAGHDRWQVYCRPSAAAGILESLPVPEFIDWGGALIQFCLPGNQLPNLPRFSGYAQRVSGASAARIPAHDPVVQRLEAGLRQKFDPRGIFAGGE